jgi:tRNA pseudouridine38-40 synthase
MTRWKATITYDGTNFHGWQIQPHRPTVQRTLAQAIHHITGETVLPQGSGRTDTGVHALGQVASFDLAAPIPPANLLHALNRALPPTIRVLSVEPVQPHFHARHSARRKTYEYRILGRRVQNVETICPPFLAPYVWTCPRTLDLESLNRAAAHVVGTHDFTSFAAIKPDQASRSASNSEEAAAAFDTLQSPPQPPEAEGPFFPIQPPRPTPNTRTIQSSFWTQAKGGTQAEDALLLYRVCGSGFLHHMVRNLVGTFVEAASHRLSPDAIPTILAARDRRAAGPTAPPQGLFLVEVEY